MACSDRYAEAWQFAGFWCLGTVITNTHLGAGPADAALSDTRINFVDAGVKKNTGMIGYNLTQGTNGYVTDVLTHALTIAGVTWNLADEYRVVTVDALEIGIIEHNLDIAAADIHQALAQVGACDCTLASWALNYLAKLNIVEAAMYHACPCSNPHFDDDQRTLLFTWVTDQISQIATLKMDLCEGETGPNWPAMAGVEIAGTEFALERILLRSI